MKNILKSVKRNAISQIFWAANISTDEVKQNKIIKRTIMLVLLGLIVITCIAVS